jgi:hypothetical protein
LIVISLGEIGYKILGMKLIWNIYSDYLVDETEKFRFNAVSHLEFLWSITRCKFVDKKKAMCVELVSSKLYDTASNEWIGFVVPRM